MNLQQFIGKYRSMPLYPILGCATYVYFIYLIIYIISYDGMWGIFGAVMSSGSQFMIYTVFELIVAIFNLICCFILKNFQANKKVNPFFDVGAIIGLVLAAQTLLSLIMLLIKVKD